MSTAQTASAQITDALARAEREQPGAAGELSELVDADLRRLAEERIAQLAPGESVQATSLVQAAWAKIAADGPRGGSRQRFLAAAAQSVRAILVERAHDAAESNAAPRLVPGAEAHVDGLDAAALDAALTELAAEAARPARIAQLRFFAGLTIAEIADFEGIDPRAVDRDLLFARTWLGRRL